MTMKYAFFSGCFAPAMARQFELSARNVAKELGLGFIDVEGFACCGFPIRSVNQETALLLAARNLSVADALGLDICTICTGCASTLAGTSKELMHNDRLREKVNEKLQQIGRPYGGNVKVKHFMRVLYEDVGPETIRSRVKKSLKGLKLAPHYGCHYLKPSSVFDRFEDPEFPRTLDELISALGAEAVDYEDRMHCCGGEILDVDDNIALMMAKSKLGHVNATGADAIVVICPLCGSMYDRNQRTIERRFNAAYDVPVLFYSQVLGLALGLEPKDLGLDMNRVKTPGLMNKLGL